MSYRKDIAEAWGRVGSVPSFDFESSFGTVQYARTGSGSPVLMSHGIQGSHADGIGMVATYFGTGCLGIAPSRFGYFDSALPDDATPALQADVYAELLDHLDVERAVMIGYSAGGPSAIEFGLHHPDRVIALVLLSSALPPSSRPPLFLAPVFRAMSRTERVFWMLKTYMPGAMRGLMGVPKGYVATPAEEATIREVSGSIFPIAPRSRGFVFDTFMGNVWVPAQHLDAITVPTLIVHSADDSLAPYENAVAAAARIPGARFVTLPKGGHLFLGHEPEVAAETRAFTDSIVESLLVASSP